MMAQSNGTRTLASCPRYSPDIMAQGDCHNCGHTADAHQRFEDTPENFDVTFASMRGTQAGIHLK